MEQVHAPPTKSWDAVPDCYNGTLVRRTAEPNSLLHAFSFISPSLQHDGANLNLSSCMPENINYYTTRQNRPGANMKRPTQND
jgi:hypothetical protein